MENKREGLMYLIRDRKHDSYNQEEVNKLGFHSYKQINCCASYSSDIGTGIHTELPSLIPIEGHYDIEVITSNDKRFNKILLAEAGRLEEAIIDRKNQLVKVENNIEFIFDAWQDPGTTRYLIRHPESSMLYLQNNSISRYSSDIGTGIHKKLPLFIDKTNSYNKLWISSHEKEFDLILREAYIGNDYVIGLERIKNHTEYTLNRYGKNLSIITDVLNKISIQKYIDEDCKKRDKLIEQMYKNCLE